MRAIAGRILPAALLVAAALAATPAGAATPDPVADASLAQKGRLLTMTVRTADQVNIGALARFPDLERPAERFLCFELTPLGASHSRRICVGGKRRNRQAAGLSVFRGDGKVLKKSALAVTVKRPSERRIVISFPPGTAGLAPKKYDWRVVSRLGACPDARKDRCDSSLPANRSFVFRVRPVRVVGCTGGTAGLVRNGPRNGKKVALTFDDGPSSYTDDVLNILESKGVHGTFFQLGYSISGNAAIERRILAEGNELANHTTNHDQYPSQSDMANTSRLIEQATHFRPCLFRPPGGAVNAAVVAAAGTEGLKTVLWDVDPFDWRLPGSGAIYSSVVGATRPGSIILMHDGGGPRGGTVAALPDIIDTLKARGYTLTTVTDLLGNRFIYKPYG